MSDLTQRVPSRGLTQRLPSQKDIGYLNVDPVYGYDPDSWSAWGNTDVTPFNPAFSTTFQDLP